MNYKNLNHLLIFFMLFTGVQTVPADQQTPAARTATVLNNFSLPNNTPTIAAVAVGSFCAGALVMLRRNAALSPIKQARTAAEPYKALFRCQSVQDAWALNSSFNEQVITDLNNVVALYSSLKENERIKRNPHHLTEVQKLEDQATRGRLFVAEILARQELNDATVRLANMFIASQDGNTVKSLQAIKQIAINFFGSSSPNPLAQTLTEAENARATCIKLKNSPIAKQSPSFRNDVAIAERALQALMQSIQTSHQYNQELAAQEKIREIEERNSRTAEENARQAAVAQRLDQERLAQLRTAQDLDIAKHADKLNLVQDNRFLREQKTNLTSELTKAKEKCQELTSQVGTLQQKLNTANHTIFSNNLKIGQLEAKIKDCENALNAERINHHNFVNQNATEKDKLNRQIQQLKDELAEARKEKKAHKKNYDLLSGQHEQLKLDLAAKDLKAKQLEAALAAARAKNPAAHEPAG